jgi:hypothetical protein
MSLSTLRGSIWRSVRRSTSRRPWLCGLLLTLCAVGIGGAAAQATVEYREARAIDALMHGGQVLYLRHTERLRGPKETLSAGSSPDAYADCSHQRNLTARGRKNAAAMGDSWRRLGIPVGKVYANAQCRTRDTAMLAFGRAQVDPRIFDQGFVLQLLLQRPDDNTNTVVVGNDAQLRELTGVTLDFGEAALIAPDGDGKVRVTARLDLDDWVEAASPH